MAFKMAGSCIPLAYLFALGCHHLTKSSISIEIVCVGNFFFIFLADLEGLKAVQVRGLQKNRTCLGVVFTKMDPRRRSTLPDNRKKKLMKVKIEFQIVNKVCKLEV